MIKKRFLLPAMVGLLLVTGCGVFKPTMAEGRVKARLDDNPVFAQDDSRIRVTVLSSTMKTVREGEAGQPGERKVADLRKGDLPEGAKRGSVVDCEVRFRQRFQSNEWGSAEAEDCRIVG
ncbi:hypothetical protein ACQP1W_43335 [Spirillospora sp. CA-255316]